MKVNGKIITSVKGLSQNFNFFEIWQKMPAFRRDVNPVSMYFTERQKEMYRFIEDAESATYKDSKLTLGNKCFTLSEEQKRVFAMTTLSQADCIRIIALFALAEKEISAELIKNLAAPFSGDGDTVILSQGKSIPLGKARGRGAALKTKRIIVAKDSPSASYVGDLCLKPGMVAFGVFSNGNLVKVCPNELSNRSYYLRFHLTDGNKSKLVAVNRSTGTTIAEYPDCTFAGMLREDNFVIINGGRVECFKDEHLQNMIRKNISLIDEPRYLDITPAAITVTLADGDKRTITY